jgi:dephospho-CoA kinase
MKPSKRPLLIAVTGTIGSGKTTVCKIIEREFSVYYADKLSHQVLNEASTSVLLQQRWGRSIIKNGLPDHKAIAGIVFDDKTELEYLNSVIHPKVLVLMNEIICHSLDKYLFFEIPLLFENHLEACFDYNLLVMSKDENIIHRLLLPNDLNEADIHKRIDNQMPIAQKIVLADYIIQNDGSESELEEQVLTWVNTINLIRHKKNIKRF